MIVSMRHTTFLVHHGDYTRFLERLRDLGIAHVHPVSEGESDQWEPLLQTIRRYRSHWMELEQRQVALGPATGTTAPELAEQFETLREERFALEQAQQQARARLNLLGPWDGIPWQQIDALQARGVYAGFYRCASSAFRQEWSDDHLLGVIRRDKAEVSFAILQKGQTLPDLAGAQRTDPPRFQKKTLLDDLKELEIRLAESDLALDQVARQRQVFRDQLDALQDEMSWTETLHHTVGQHDDRLMLLEAWIPSTRMDTLAEALRDMDVVWRDRTPRPGEDIPVLLRNNRFARLFHPIVELFSLPMPTEMDLTPWFAPFFTLFFGLCLGDLGYGLLLFLGATVASLVSSLAHQRSLFRLIQWLSLATMLAGILTGTIFGADLGRIGPFSGLAGQFLGADQLFQLALWIGLVQILFGMVLRTVNRSRQFGFVYGVSSIGWILLVIGLTLLWYALLPLVSTILIGAGLVLILLFSDPEAGILKRFGLGLWDLYGISGLFGDLLSYIRLFALGLSSSILGLVVNDIALSVKGDGSIPGWFFFLLILLVGHGMNFGIATLSAFVHPMRLTFVEFYKNAGFTGGGKPYSPFAKRLKPQS